MRTYPPQAIRAGHTTVVALADQEAVRQQADRLASQGYVFHETPHFMVFHRPHVHHRFILLHRFDERTVDEDLPAIIANELGSIGVVTTAVEHDHTLGAIIASSVSRSLPPCPHCGRVHVDLGTAWRQYCLNTLVRYRQLMDEEPAPPTAPESHIAQFGAIYRRVIDRCVGVSLLDVGSSLGFLPILVAEHHPSMTVVGCDSRVDVISCASDVSATHPSDRISFVQRNVLDNHFPEVGCFDTVTAVHLLEHLTEEQMPVALTNMLSVTAKRLIVSVPYEESLQTLYGHQQVFTFEKLQFWGGWCAHALGGGRFRCEDVSGGLLVVDRSAHATGKPGSMPPHGGSG
jgi:SAM-dependent methyltransferase